MSNGKEQPEQTKREGSWEETTNSERGKIDLSKVPWKHFQPFLFISLATLNIRIPDLFYKSTLLWTQINSFSIFETIVPSAPCQGCLRKRLHQVATFTEPASHWSPLFTSLAISRRASRSSDTSTGFLPGPDFCFSNARWMVENHTHSFGKTESPHVKNSK